MLIDTHRLKSNPSSLHTTLCYHPIKEYLAY